MKHTSVPLVLSSEAWMTPRVEGKEIKKKRKREKTKQGA